MVNSRHSSNQSPDYTAVAAAAALPHGPGRGAGLKRAGSIKIRPSSVTNPDPVRSRARSTRRAAPSASRVPRATPAWQPSAGPSRESRNAAWSARDAQTSVTTKPPSSPRPAACESMPGWRKPRGRSSCRCRGSKQDTLGPGPISWFGLPPGRDDRRGPGFRCGEISDRKKTLSPFSSLSHDYSCESNRVSSIRFLIWARWPRAVRCTDTRSAIRPSSDAPRRGPTSTPGRCTALKRLANEGLVREVRTERVGNRPERTVY